MNKKHGMVLIGGSAGSLDIVLRILPTFTDDLGVPIVIILHRKNSGDNILVELLSTRTDLLVKEADEKEEFLPNVIYIAPADYHLLIERDLTFSLDASEKVNYSRPSIDVTFECAADVFGAGAAGILLSGANADGVEGLRKIKAVGGMIIVQDPTSADVPYMPQQAINKLEVDLILMNDKIDQLAGRLLDFSNR